MAEVKMDMSDVILPGANTSKSKMNAPVKEPSHMNNANGKPIPRSVQNEIKKQEMEGDKNGAILKKKTFGEKFKETFIKEDAKDVGDYLLHEILIPTITETIVNSFKNAIELFFFGEVSRGGNSRNGRGNNTYVSYSSYSSRNQQDMRRGSSRYDNRTRNISDNGDIIFNSRSTAQEVLNELFDIISQYRCVSVADYYEEVKRRVDIDIPSSHQDNNWGWTNLSYTDIIPARGGGWIIDLPKAVYLN